MLSEFVVYKIVCKDPLIKDFYIGSTKDLQRRICAHNNTSKNKTSNMKIHEFMRNNGGPENFDFEILHKETFIDIKSTRITEQTYINNLKPTLNINRAHATEENYRQTKLKYSQTEKGKDKQKKLHKTEKYKEKNKINHKLYNATENGNNIIKKSQKKHRQTEKYKIYVEQYKTTDKYKQKCVFYNIYRRAKKHFEKVLKELIKSE